MRCRGVSKKGREFTGEVGGKPNNTTQQLASKSHALPVERTRDDRKDIMDF
jgi:hypothetical protein